MCVLRQCTTGTLGRVACSTAIIYHKLVDLYLYSDINSKQINTQNVIYNFYKSCAGLARAQLAASGVAAAWRLGRWQELGSFLEAATSGDAGLGEGEQWELRIGGLLAAIHARFSDNYSSLFEKKIRED